MLTLSANPGCHPAGDPHADGGELSSRPRCRSARYPRGVHAEVRHGLEGPPRDPHVAVARRGGPWAARESDSRRVVRGRGTSRPRRGRSRTARLPAARVTRAFRAGSRVNCDCGAESDDVGVFEQQQLIGDHPFLRCSTGLSGDPAPTDNRRLRGALHHASSKFSSRILDEREEPARVRAVISR